MTIFEKKARIKRLKKAREIIRIRLRIYDTMIAKATAELK